MIVITIIIDRMGYIIHLKKLPSAKPKKPESPGYPPAKL